MNRKEAAEIAAYAATVRTGGTEIMCHLSPGDVFRFLYTDTRYKAGKSCWYRRADGTGPAYRTGRLTAVILISHAQN